MVKNLGQLNHGDIGQCDRDVGLGFCRQLSRNGSAVLISKRKRGLPLYGRKMPWSVEEGGIFSCRRHRKTGSVLEIPNGFLHEGPEGVQSGDITDSRLAVEQGEVLGVALREKDRWLIRKGSALGWLFLQ